VTLSERWQSLIGVRYIDYDSTTRDGSGVTILRQIEHALVPSSGLVFKPVPNVTTYASYSRGLEQGEFAPFFANNAGQQTAPVKSKQVEAGVKASVGRRYDLGVAVFNVEKQAGYVNLDNFFVLDGTQRHRGVEMTGSARVAGLKLGASLAYLDTELLEVTELATLGNRTEGTPEWSGGLSLDYDVPAVKGLSLGSTVTYSSDRAVDAQNSGFIDGYTVVDASMQYNAKWGDRATRVRLNVRNLFDTYYYSSAFFFGGLNVGRPREVILSVSTDF
jgi:iron complex outermembrane receptor protein